MALSSQRTRADIADGEFKGADMQDRLSVSEALTLDKLHGSRQDFKKAGRPCTPKLQPEALGLQRRLQACAAAGQGDQVVGMVAHMQAFQNAAQARHQHQLGADFGNEVRTTGLRPGELDAVPRRSQSAFWSAVL